MPLQSKYDTLEDIPETVDVRDLYEERDGEFVLKKDAIVGVKSEADIVRLQKALTKERTARKTAETSLSLFPGSPEDMAAELDALKDKSNTPNQTQLREVEKLKQELSNSVSQVGVLQNTIGAQTLKNMFVKEASDQGVNTSALEDVLLWGEKLFTVKDGEVVSKDDNNLQTPSDWLSELKSSGKKDYWFVQSQGGGAQGSKGGVSATGVEHFSKGTSNLTRMSAIYLEDKDKANRLAKLAGHADFDAAIVAHGK